MIVWRRSGNSCYATTVAILVVFHLDSVASLFRPDQKQQNVDSDSWKRTRSSSANAAATAVGSQSVKSGTNAGSILSDAAGMLQNAESNSPGIHNIQPNYRTPAKYCYQCAYSPPRTYPTKDRKASSSSKAGTDGMKTTGHGTLKLFGGSGSVGRGGWDKCLGPFDELQAAEYGVDVWQCHSNCYTRRDPNGDLFRGCYKGEFGVDPSLDGCHYQSGSIYCFCDADRCNNGVVPVYSSH